MSSVSSPTSLTAGSVTTTGNMTVGGNLSVSGTTTSTFTATSFYTDGSMTAGSVTSSGAVTAGSLSTSGTSSLAGVSCSSLTSSGAISGTSGSFSSSVSLLNGMTSSGNISINKKTMYLGTDTNHFLRYVGSSNTFNSYTTDGPALVGWSGVLLGTMYGGERVNLVTDTSGTYINNFCKVQGYYTVGGNVPLIKIAYGYNSSGFSSGTQSYGTGISFTSPPYVVTQMITSSNYQMFICHVNTVTTSGFNYQKVYQQGTSTNQASSEQFHWIAIGV